MKIRNMMLKYYNAAGADGADSGGGDQSGGDQSGGDQSGGGQSGGGQSGGDWTTGLSDAHRTHLTKNGIKDVGGLIDNHIDAQSYVGNSIRIPSEDASAEARADFIAKLQKGAPELMMRPKAGEDNASVYSALGRPDEVTGYEGVEVPENIQGQFGEERLAAFQGIAHKHNLTKDQFKGVMSEILAADAQTATDAQTHLAEGQNALKSEWGAAYDERSALVNSVLAKTGAPEAIQNAFKNGAATGDAMKWMHNMAARLGGGGADAFQDEGQSGTLTPTEAKMQMGEIMDNKSHPYWDAGHPDHKTAIDKVIGLGRLASPKTANQKVKTAESWRS